LEQTDGVERLGHFDLSILMCCVKPRDTPDPTLVQQQRRRLLLADDDTDAYRSIEHVCPLQARRLQNPRQFGPLLKHQLDNSDEFGFFTLLDFLFEMVGFFCHTSVFLLF
jgi:hypothetical protein